MKTEIKAENNIIDKKIEFIDYYSASIPWIMSLIWPCVILFMIIIFNSTISEILDRISSTFQQASEITLWNVQLDVNSSISSQTSTDVKNALSGLSRDGFNYLLKYGEMPEANDFNTLGNCPWTKEQFYSHRLGFSDLEKRGMIIIISTPNDDCSKKWQWKWTPLGKESFKEVKEILFEQIINAWRST
jgi:hypothetical protein